MNRTGVSEEIMKKYTERWIIRNKSGNVSDLVKNLGITPQFARLLWNRGYQSEEQVTEYLYPGNEAVPSGDNLPDAKVFYHILLEKQAQGARVRVIGDYDVDGVTATYVMLAGLYSLGIPADYRIPDRVIDGYGISNAMVEECVRDGVDTIITVDNGVAALEQIAYAKKHGLTVLVTDHHEPREELPMADAIVDPKRRDTAYYADNLCGAVVAAKLMDMVLRLQGKPGYLRHVSEILALATVCDVMELTGESRTIVKMGLAKDRSRWNYGLRTLVNICGLAENVRVSDMGFLLGPCINALGRMETADFGVELLLTQEEEKAVSYSQRMVAVNKLRKEQTAVGLAQAKEYMERQGYSPEDVLVIPLRDCHESLAGIIAGRIREQYHRPTIVLTESEQEPGLWKGSARSIEAYSIFEGLCACEAHLVRYGGHAMAAGVTLREEKIDEFRQGINAHFASTGADVTKTVAIDLVMNFAHVTQEFVEEIECMEPFGKGNAKPILATRNVTLVRMGYIGKESKYLKLVLQDEDGSRVTALYFKDAEEFVAECQRVWGEEACGETFAGRGVGRLHILYSAEIREYRGTKEVQLLVDNVQILS